MARKQAPSPKKQQIPKAVTLRRPWLVLALAATDKTFVPALASSQEGGHPVWVGKCIHCRSPLVVAPQRPERGHVTLEHIVPQTLGGTDTPDNLALACARCNNQKGSRLDGLGLGHPRLAAVIERLQAERARRLRPVPASFILPPQAEAWLAGSQDEGADL